MTRSHSLSARRLPRASGFTRTALLITCEHGGNSIPDRYRKLFAGAAETLKSHRGWDPGALRVARRMSDILNAPLYFSTTSRLLVELNRSLRSPILFSEFTSGITESEQRALIAEFYTPYRGLVSDQIQKRIEQGSRVVHLSIHSFTPIWNGKVRGTSIGLLYDPRRALEFQLCSQWKRDLKQSRPDLVIHCNRPYRGISDGFTTSLRRQFPDTRLYAGIEVEINQSLLQMAAPKQISQLAMDLCSTLQTAIGS